MRSRRRVATSRRKVSMFTTDERPRRTALGTLAATGLALFGLSKSAAVGANKKRNRNRNRNRKQAAPRPLTLLLSDEAEFDVAAGEENFGAAMCPDGSLVVSGQVSITNPLCTPVLLGFNGNATAWQLTLKCPPGESSAGNTSQALCLKGAKLGN
jgi:hypothetical protein